MKLRPYQKEAYDATLAKFEKTDTALCVMATGLGKTIYFAHIVDHFRKKGRIMVLAHREELIFQAQDKMKKITGVEADVEMGDLWSGGSFFFPTDIVVSTIQTHNAGREQKRMERFDPHEFSLLVIDEAHHAPADSYKRVIDYYRQNKNLKVLGVTATPDRHDKKAMGQIFDEVAYQYDMRDGIDDGWLVDVDQQSKFLDSLDYSQVRSQAGELNGKDLAKVLEHENMPHAFVDGIMQYAGEKKTLVFAATVVQAKLMTEIFNRPNRKPGSARYVTGKTPKDTRRQTLEDFKGGVFQYLVNVGVFTEGADIPSIQCIALGRPTESRSLYEQMIGRGLRILTEVEIDQYSDVIARREAIAASKKPVILVIDFVGNAGKHKLITAADILGGKYDDEVVELAAKNAAEQSDREGKPVNLATVLEQAEREWKRSRAEEEDAVWRDQIKLRAKFSSAKINPFDVMDVNPVREVPWHKDRQPSQKQLDFLKKNGVNIEGMDYTNIKHIIETIIRRSKEGKPSYRQTQQLFKRGIDCTMITREEAGKMMNELANNPIRAWMTPRRWLTLPCYRKRRA